MSEAMDPFTGHLPSSSEVSPLRTLRKYGEYSTQIDDVSGTIIKLEGMSLLSYRSVLILLT
jgi:hypothetical protein